jgi:hypothetical protein
MLRAFTDTDVVNAFVEYLRSNFYPNLKIDKRPEKDNRSSKDIDALAGQFAIEHTSIDTVKNQTRDSAWFLEVFGGIEAEISDHLNYRLSITLPYDGIRRGQNWPSIREALKNWILHFSSMLRDGRHLIDNVTKIPFQFHANKATDRKPGLIFYRLSPVDNDFVNRLQAHLNRKAKKLEPYQGKGFKTILLVESDDIALMDEGFMLDGIRTAFSRDLPKGVDQIWYADTSIPESILFHNFTAKL